MQLGGLIINGADEREKARLVECNDRKFERCTPVISTDRIFDRENDCVVLRFQRKAGEGFDLAPTLALAVVNVSGVWSLCLNAM